MRKLIPLILSLSLLTANVAVAQDPIQWNFTAKKISGTKYHLLITATIKAGWHLYSQTQPSSAIALPTVIEFKKNPIASFNGKVTEQGKIHKVKDQALDIESWQYSGEVRFIQIVELKAKAKTNISGSIEFQACTDEKCLPPKTVDFSIALE